MNKVKFDDIVKDKECVVQCTTFEKAKLLMIIASNRGLKWKNGETYLDGAESIYNNHGPMTCYDFFEGQYGSVKYYQYEKKKIVDFKDVDFSEEENVCCKNAKVIQEFDLKVMTNDQLVALSRRINKEMCERIARSE